MNRHGSPGLGPTRDASNRVQKPEGLSAADKLAALKARVAAAVGSSSQAKGGLSTPIHPVLAGVGSSSQSKGGLSTPIHPVLAEMSAPPQKNVATGGLAVGLHPALADLGAPPKPFKSNQSKNSKYTPKPKSTAPEHNPYLADSSTLPATGAKPRQSRQLVFNQKGKYIAQANALRRQAALEELKRKITQTTKRIEDDSEKSFLVEAPPAIEWTDEGLLSGPSYDSEFKIDTPDSIITAYIQHPVAIEPPQDKNIPEPKPMYLTPKEQAKMRRQRRMADLRELQAKQRLGLVEPEKPKVKMSNLMRVLGQEAVLDPSAVEAKVRKEVAERHDEHLQRNDERKLTKEQRHEKLATNQEKDAAQGLHVLVFKITTLVNGQHRFKIGRNAEQLALTGACVMHPKQSLVIVEGGSYSTRKYKQLMLNRIDWTENAPSRDKSAEKTEAMREWLKAEDERGLKDLGANKCELLFEGDIRERAFGKWGSRVMESDTDARDYLQRFKYQEFWNVAKSMP
ncbi:hypothetical protein PG997_000285 [Apiospora hydei]|uniref:Uncharacterized protein n=1 Tax=Apiospora hydei TaxID=1337664 RepID=A0ABR1XAC9_9PEZI